MMVVVNNTDRYKNEEKSEDECSPEVRYGVGPA